jgi:hypothetical protein
MLQRKPWKSCKTAEGECPVVTVKNSSFVTLIALAMVFFFVSVSYADDQKIKARVPGIT